MKENFKKGFDLYSKEISDYIINNGLNDYEKGKPNKVDIFIFSGFYD